MGELSRNRPLQPRKLTRKCGEIENEFGKSKAMFIRLTLFLCSASTPKEQQTITGSLPRFLV